MKNGIKKIPMRRSLCMRACVAAALLLAWASPGSTELTVKTSEFNKAMRGEVAEIMVDVKNSSVITNIDDKVITGFKDVNTGRDFALVILECKEKNNESKKDNESEKETESLSPEIEDREGGITIFKKEWRYRASLTRNGILVRDKVGEKDYIHSFEVDPMEGTLNDSEMNLNDNKEFMVLSAAFMGFRTMWDTLKTVDGKKNSKGEKNSVQTMYEKFVEFMLNVLHPISMDSFTFAIEGDDDKPVLVVGKEVKVDDKLVENYRAWIRKGDKVRIEANTKMRGNGVRFFETEAQADAAEPIAWK